MKHLYMTLLLTLFATVIHAQKDKCYYNEPDSCNRLKPVFRSPDFTDAAFHYSIAQWLEDMNKILARDLPVDSVVSLSMFNANCSDTGNVNYAFFSLFSADSVRKLDILPEEYVQGYISKSGKVRRATFLNLPGRGICIVGWDNPDRKKIPLSAAHYRQAAASFNIEPVAIGKDYSAFGPRYSSAAILVLGKDSTWIARLLFEELQPKTKNGILTGGYRLLGVSTATGNDYELVAEFNKLSMAMRKQKPFKSRIRL